MPSDLDVPCAEVDHPPPERAPLEGARLLVVEDEAITAMDLRLSLEELGHTVTAVAGSAEQALAAVQRDPPDLVLMDIRLPGQMDGIATATQLRRDWGIPTVFLTGFADSALIERAKAAEPYGYLIKPFEPREVHATILIALERHRDAHRVRIHRERLRSALAAAEMSAWDWDLDTLTLKTSGPRGIEMTLPHFLARVHPDDRAKLESALLAPMGADQELHLLFRQRNPEHGWRWLEAHGRVSVLAGRRPHLYGVVKDVTHEHDHNKRLRTAAAAFEAAGEAIVSIGADARITSVNAAFTRMTGHAEAAVRGKDLALLSAEGQRQVRTCLDLGPSWHGQVACLRRDGTPFTAWMSVRQTAHEQAPSGVVVVLADIHQLKHTEDTLRRMAHYDALTALPNRVLLADRLDGAIARSRRSERAFSLICLDLNGFKQVNDVHGHAEGDALLQQVAQRLQDCARADDTVARLGGDEFMIVAEGLNEPEEIRVLCERIVQALSVPFQLDRAQVACGASLGVALFPRDGACRDALMRAADAAMYRAKTSRTNGYHLHDVSRDASRDLAQADVPSAPPEPPATWWCEPQWHGPSGQLEAVDVHVLDASGRHAPLSSDIRLLEQACVQWSELTQHHPHVRLSLPAACLDLGTPERVSGIAACLARRGIQPAQIDVVVDSLWLQATPATVAALRALRHLGCGLVLRGHDQVPPERQTLDALPLTGLRLPASALLAARDAAPLNPRVMDCLQLAERHAWRIVVDEVLAWQQLSSLRARPHLRWSAQGPVLCEALPLNEWPAFCPTARPLPQPTEGATP